MCWPTSTAPAPPTDLPRRSMDDWNTCAARPSGSATSPTTSHDRSSRPADSDPTYNLDPDEPPILRLFRGASIQQASRQQAAYSLVMRHVEVPDLIEMPPNLLPPPVGAKQIVSLGDD